MDKFCSVATCKSWSVSLFGVAVNTVVSVIVVYLMVAWTVSGWLTGTLLVNSQFLQRAACMPVCLDDAPQSRKDYCGSRTDQSCQWTQISDWASCILLSTKCVITALRRNDYSPTQEQDWDRYQESFPRVLWCRKEYSVVCMRDFWLLLADVIRSHMDNLGWSNPGVFLAQKTVYHTCSTHKLEESWSCRTTTRMERLRRGDETVWGPLFLRPLNTISTHVVGWLRVQQQEGCNWDAVSHSMV